MKIKEIHLTDHKRFTAMSILDLPVEARLVVVIGPHGCGKSSLFDALHTWHGLSAGYGVEDKDGYYGKGAFDAGEGMPQPRSVYDPRKAIRIVWHTPLTLGKATQAVYVRTAYRNTPSLMSGRFQSPAAMESERRFSRMTENDSAVAMNYQRLVWQALEKATGTESPETTMGEYRRNLLGPLQESMRRLFSAPQLILDNLGNPSKGKSFAFTKGISKEFPYTNLSAGEKAAFDLLLDFFIKRTVFDNTVYCIDEPEVHMGTQLQGDLLEEMLRLIPGESQLWIATHSIGMLRRAFDMSRKAPKEVVFLDFTGFDFDRPVEIRPSSSGNLWKKIHSIALDDLANFTAPNQIVICEGKPEEGGKSEFDAECYQAIFEEELPDAVFIPVGSHSSVRGDALLLVIPKISEGSKIYRVIDLDDRGTEEVKKLKARGINVLQRRCIECYLLDDEVLRRFFVKLAGDREGGEIADALVKSKNDFLRDKPPNSIKAAANYLCKEAKKILPDTYPPNSIGTDGDAFMRHKLAPCVRGTESYDELREVIFGK